MFTCVVKLDILSAFEVHLSRDSFIILISAAFSGRPDSLIDKIISHIKLTDNFNVDEIYEVILSDQRQIKISPDQLFKMGYGSQNIHLIFNLWHPRADYTPSWHGNSIQVDHIFPQSILKKQGINKSKIDQLANCMLLTQNENGAGNKTDKLPEEWFKDKSNEYLDLHCIPKNSALWSLDNFDSFIAERKKLILSKFSYLVRDLESS